jgi:hypothetical protein
MPARNFPGLGIKGGYADAESGWGSDINANLLKLSVLVQAGANAFVAALPSSPVNGDIYVLTTDQSINAYDNGAWVAFVPLEGWEIYDRDQNKAMRFDGAAWAEVTSGSGGGDASFPPYAGNAGKALFVNATEDGVEWDDVESGGSGGGGAGVTHRYWRASFHRTGQLIAIAEMEFMGAVGGPDLTSAAEANARTIGGPQYNGYPLAKAFNDVHDGSEGNMAALADADSMTLGWDFGADGAQVVSMTFQTRSSYRQDPTQGWDMQWSDDNVTWTTQWTIPPQSGWGDAEIRTFNDPAPQVGGNKTIPALSGNGGKALFVKADESGLEWDDAASGGGSSNRVKAAAYITCDGSGAPTLVKGTNIASVTRTGVGRFRITFTTHLSDTNLNLNAHARFTDYNDNWTASVGIDRHPNYGFTTNYIDLNITSTQATGVYDPAFFGFELYDPSVS